MSVEIEVTDDPARACAAMLVGAAAGDAHVRIPRELERARPRTASGRSIGAAGSEAGNDEDPGRDGCKLMAVHPSAIRLDRPVRSRRRAGIEVASAIYETLVTINDKGQLVGFYLDEAGNTDGRLIQIVGHKGS